MELACSAADHDVHAGVGGVRRRGGQAGARRLCAAGDRLHAVCQRLRGCAQIQICQKSRVAMSARHAYLTVQMLTVHNSFSSLHDICWTRTLIREACRPFLCRGALQRSSAQPRPCAGPLAGVPLLLVHGAGLHLCAAAGGARGRPGNHAAVRVRPLGCWRPCSTAARGRHTGKHGAGRQKPHELVKTCCLQD